MQFLINVSLAVWVSRLISCLRIPHYFIWLEITAGEILVLSVWSKTACLRRENLCGAINLPYIISADDCRILWGVIPEQCKNVCRLSVKFFSSKLIAANCFLNVWTYLSPRFSLSHWKGFQWLPVKHWSSRDFWSERYTCLLYTSFLNTKRC